MAQFKEKFMGFLNSDTLVSNKTTRKKHPMLMAFIITQIVLWITLIKRGVYPFGDSCFLFGDFVEQYYPFMMYYKHALLEGKSLEFSWNLGLGANFYSVFCYYLASPLNLLVMLVPDQFVLEFMEIMIAVKIGLCASSFAYYLSKHFRTNSYAVSAFGLAYALGSYMAAHFYILMWLDVIILAPLVILSLEKMIEKKSKGTSYCILLAIAMISNYYMAMHLCIFLCLYFVMQMALHKYQKELSLKAKIRFAGKALLQFALYSILAALIAGFILVPTVFFIKNTGYSSGYFPSDWNFYYAPWEVLARHMKDVNIAFDSHRANVYCGVLVFMLLPIFFFQKKISLKKKIVYGLAIVFMWCCFSLNVLNYICHGLNYPNCLPCRQGFLYDFLVLTVCFEAIRHRISVKKGILALALSLVFFVAMFFRCTDKDVSFQSYWMTLLFLVAEGVILLLYYRKKIDRGFIMALVTLVVMVELYMNMNAVAYGMASRSEYMNRMEAYQKAIAEAKKQQTTPLERMEEAFVGVSNKSLISDFHSTSMFSSSINSAANHFYNSMGAASNGSTFYWNKDGTPIFNMLLNVNYIFTKDGELECSYLHKVAEAGEYEVYECTAKLPFGYVISKEAKEAIEQYNGNPKDIVNNYCKALGCTQDLLIEVEESVPSIGEAALEVKEDGFYYVTAGNARIPEVTIEIYRTDNTYTTFGYETVSGEMLHCVRTLHKGDIVRLVSTKQNYTSAKLLVSLYKLNDDAVEELKTIQKDVEFELLSYDETHLEGRVTTPKDGNLVLSMANEDGWELYVDGEKTEISTLSDLLISVPVEAGTHEIRLEYHARGLRAGILCSIAGGVILLIVMIVGKNKNKI